MKRSKHEPEAEIIQRSKKKKKKHNDVMADPSYNAESAKSVTNSGRSYTVSVALPGSIIDNAQTAELRTYLAGQVARAIAIFNVDEVIIFDEKGLTQDKESRNSDPNIFLGRMLHYLETPQYLRKALFPMHPDLKYVGVLNPLDCPHHMRQSDPSPYREGVVLERPGCKLSSLVDCGLDQDVQIDKKLRAGVRVTVSIDDTNQTGLKGYVVSPSTPRTERGLYWGYTVRMASSFGAVFTESPHQGGYDLTIGTSERGQNVDDLCNLPPFKHVLIVLGGVRGLEYALECDQSLHVDDVSLLFHHYLNVCPNQGSRTIRTEEALLVVLTSLGPLLTSANQSLS